MFDEGERMEPSPKYDRVVTVVDILDGLDKYTLLSGEVKTYPSARYGERKEIARMLSKRVTLKRLVL